MRRLFVDLDGVLADFDRHFPERFGIHQHSIPEDQMWKMIIESGDFFRTMPLMEGALEFWSSLKSKMHPIVLTACPSSDHAGTARQKVAWVQEHFGKEVIVLPVRGGKMKPIFMQNPGDILIDDWQKNCDVWNAAGGSAILFEDSSSALSQYFDIILSD